MSNKSGFADKFKGHRELFQKCNPYIRKYEK